MNEQNKIITYQEVLQRFHDEFEDKSIKTELIQVPSPENNEVAIVKAVVRGNKDGNLYSFEGIGDASPHEADGMSEYKRKNQPVVTATTRMAETRSKGRALRDITNAKGTLLEEAEHHAEEEAPPPAPPEEMRGAAKNAKPKMAGKSQVDILRVLAKDLRGEDGPARLEARIGKPLEDLTFDEANDWIERCSPEGQPVEAGSV